MTTANKTRSLPLSLSSPPPRHYIINSHWRMHIAGTAGTHTGQGVLLDFGGSGVNPSQVIPAA